MTVKNNLSHYVSAEEQPLDLILLFDINGSMHHQMKKIAAVAHQGLGELRPGDRVAVMVFDTDTRVIASFSDDLSGVERSIERVLKLHFRGGPEFRRVSTPPPSFHLLG
jgi:Mg-chelatase subunit ChlD